MALSGGGAVMAGVTRIMELAHPVKREPMIMIVAKRHPVLIEIIAFSLSLVLTFRGPFPNA